MGIREKRTSRFKEKGSGILNATPGSVSEFLEGKDYRAEKHISASEKAEMHKSDFAQNHKRTKPENLNCTTPPKPIQIEAPQEVERLHVHIRKDLADKLMEVVFMQKKDRKTKKGSVSQRNIVEKALKEYFKRHRL